MNIDNYIVLDKRVLQGMIDRAVKGRYYDQEDVDAVTEFVNEVLAASKPLTPLIEDAFDAGVAYDNDALFGIIPNKYPNKADYITKLEL